MRVMVFQPEAAGHHMILYLRYLAREAIARGWDLHLVTTQEAVDHPAYAIVRDEFGGRLQTSVIPDARYPGAHPSTLRLLRYQLRQYSTYRRAFARLARTHPPDVVYIVNFDFIDKAMAMLGSPFRATPFAGMLMAVRFHHARLGVPSPVTRHDRLYEWLFRRLLRIPTLGAIAVIDEPLSDLARRSPFPGSEKIFFVPDAAAGLFEASREDARRALGISDDQVVVLAYGGLSKRKGVAELIRAAATPSCPKAVALLLAGTQDPFTRAVLAEAPAQRLQATGRLFTIAGFLNDQQEDLAFRAADLVWLGYLDFYGSSGVLLQAARRGLPVVASRAGLVGWTSSKHRLGEEIDPTDPGEVVAALSRLAGDAAYRSECAERGRRLAETHTPEHFGAAVCDAIAAAARLGAAPEGLHATDPAGGGLLTRGR
jgi:glycosyltransferase involved in cell wall biosynthesis